MEIRQGLRRELIETPTAKESVLYANTPSFLFERLCKDSSASYVAHELSTSDILTWLKEKSSRPDTAIELLWVYVFLAALSLKAAPEIDAIAIELKDIDLSRVQWGDYFRTAILNKAVRTNVVSINYHSGAKDFETSSTTRVAGQVVNAGRR